MKKIGIICEYNPLHYGHVYHFEKVKELFPDSLVFAVIGGAFSQRGDVSILSKWDKTEAALEMGVALVLELPFVFASQGADVFAKGAIEILKELRVDYIVFGSESDDISKLERLSSIALEDTRYEVCVQEFMKEGYSYPRAMAKAFEVLGETCVQNPNDILGLCYIKEIKRQKASIQPITIKRTNNYHMTILEGDISSATSIRAALQEKKDISSFVPEYVFPHLKSLFIDDYFSFLRYKVLVDKDRLVEYQTVDEGIERRIYQAMLKSECFSDFLLCLKTKRYTYNRIRRMLVHILCGFTKEENLRCQHIHYIRVLGFNACGQAFLKEIKGYTSVPIITRYGQIKDEMLEIEFRVNVIYGLFQEKKNDWIRLEYAHKPIIR